MKSNTGHKWVNPAYNLTFGLGQDIITKITCVCNFDMNEPPKLKKRKSLGKTLSPADYNWLRCDFED